MLSTLYPSYFILLCGFIAIDCGEGRHAIQLSGLLLAFFWYTNTVKIVSVQLWRQYKVIYQSYIEQERNAKSWGTFQDYFGKSLIMKNEIECNVNRYCFYFNLYYMNLNKWLANVRGGPRFVR